MDPYSQKRQRLEYGHHFATNGGHAPQFVGTINGFVAPGPAYDQQHLPYSSGPADMAAVTAAADYGTTYYASAGEEAMGLTLPSSMPMAYSQVAFDSAAMNGLHCIQNGMRHAPSLQDHIQHSQHRSSEEAYPDATYFPGTPATWSASLHGLPTSDSYQETENEYVSALSPKKQDKALISAQRCENIKKILIDKKCTTIESAQFRFWAKKMFTLGPSDKPLEQQIVCHEGKQVAVKEKLFAILVRAHMDCQHGGRDKTSAQVRQRYSWVPKELIARFVKSCPTCAARRNPVGYSVSAHSTPGPTAAVVQQTPPGSQTTSPVTYTPSRPSVASPPESRRQSFIKPEQNDYSFPMPPTTTAAAVNAQNAMRAHAQAHAQPVTITASMGQHIESITGRRSGDNLSVAVMHHAESGMQAMAGLASDRNGVPHFASSGIFYD